MSHSKLFSGLMLASLLFTGLSKAGSWRSSCSTIQTGRVDPVVSPGEVATHVYKIAGASNIGLSSTYEDLQTAVCTSCEIQADKSAYSTPLLYYQYSNGTFQEVAGAGMAVYYLARGDNLSNIKPFPPGFRMHSGNTLSRSYDKMSLMYKNTRPIADRVSFACLDTASQTETPGMVNTSCKKGLRAQIHFQSCWNGVDLYKPDNSHVDYLSGMDSGVCSPGYPVQLMHLVYDVLYSLDSITPDGGRYVFSNGDPTGKCYGFHGSFLNGWDMDVQTAAVEKCGIADDHSTKITSCPPLVASDIRGFPQRCPRQPAVVDEPTSGLFPKLPGCIEVVSGPAGATEADQKCPSISGLPSSASNIVATEVVKELKRRSADPASTTTSSRIVSPSTKPTSYINATSPFNSTKPVNTTSIFSTCISGTAPPTNTKFSIKTTSTVKTSSTINSSATATTSATSKSVKIVNPINGEAASGCWALNTNFTPDAAWTSLTGMTEEVCSSFCSSVKEYRDFGVAGGNTCYCDSNLQSNSKKVDSSECNIPCTGNTGELCGGKGAFLLWLSG